MKRALFALLVLSLTAACPGEKKPEAGDLEPLAFDPSATPPPPPAPPKPAPAPVVAAAPAAEVNTCCVFSDGNRMKGLTAEECKESAGTFDPKCDAKLAEPPAAEAAPGEAGASEEPCCTFPNGMMRRGVPQEACDAAKGVYSLDCDDDQDSE
ncbi:MAG: hypothetical protein P1V51_13470 [Deltaproteobacteria bacterium]|nr:hypothetical protein [Deltaproteobacteria bacterium]